MSIQDDTRLLDRGGPAPSTPHAVAPFILARGESFPALISISSFLNATCCNSTEKATGIPGPGMKAVIPGTSAPRSAGAFSDLSSGMAISAPGRSG